MKEGLFAFISFLITSYPILCPTGKTNLLLQFIHLLIAFICSLSLFRYSDRPYTLHKMINLFFLFFLCIAPIMQYSQDIVLWGGKNFSDSDYLLASFCVLITLLIYEFVYDCVVASNIYRKGEGILSFLSSDYIYAKKISKTESRGLVLLSCILLFVLLYVHNFNLLSLFFRGTMDMDQETLIEVTNIVEVPQSMSLIVDNFLRPMGVVIFLFLYILKVPKYFLFFAAFLMLLIAFPLSMPRFSVAALYIPVVLQTIPFMRRRNFFVLLAIIGILIVFPFLDNFRYFTYEKELHLGLNFDMFLEGHFDSYSSFMRVLTNNIVTNGYQFLGVILFWVPRSIWPTKPIGSGAYMCDILGLDFSNISCCYLAEGFINGGFLGLLIFILLLAFITAFLDNLYWKVFIRNEKGYFGLIYFMLLGLFFFVMRGDLLSSFAYTIGFLFSAVIVYIMIYYKRRYKFVIKL